MPDEALVPWFYRVLRNAAIDRHRRTGALRPEYAEVLRAVDVEETPVKTFAKKAGLTVPAENAREIGRVMKRRRLRVGGQREDEP